MGERGVAAAVLDVDVGARLHQRFDRRDVLLAAIAEHDAHDQGGPPHRIDVIERSLGLDQRLHDLHVPEMRRRDQRRPIVVAGDRARIGAALDPDLEQLHVIVDGSDGQKVEALQVARVRIGAEPQQCAHRLVMLAVGGDDQRRAAVGVLKVDLLALSDQFFDLGYVAVGGGGVQAGIDAKLAIRRRHLRLERGGRSRAERRKRCCNGQ